MYSRAADRTVIGVVTVLLSVLLVYVLFQIVINRPDSRERVKYEILAEVLPKGCVNLTDLGNDWWSFSRDVGGVEHEFVIRVWRDTHGTRCVSVTCVD